MSCRCGSYRHPTLPPPILTGGKRLAICVNELLDARLDGDRLRLRHQREPLFLPDVQPFREWDGKLRSDSRDRPAVRGRGILEHRPKQFGGRLQPGGLRVYDPRDEPFLIRAAAKCCAKRFDLLLAANVEQPPLSLSRRERG